MKKMNKEEFINKMINKGFTYIETEYILPEEIQDASTHISVIHKKCGKKYSVTPHNLLLGKKCPFCAKEERAKHKTSNSEVFLEKLNNKFIYDNGYKFTLLSEYTHNKDIIIVKHGCGEIIDDKSAMYILSHGCKKCNLEKKRLEKRLSVDEMQKRLNNVYGEGEYIVNQDQNVEIYNKKVLVQHKCGKKREYFFNNLLKKIEACSCITNRRSVGEKELSDYISSILPEGTNIELNKHFKRDYELDIYIPELQIGFEYDGLYWHSDKINGEFNLKEKRDYFKKLGIRVIFIFEDEWKNKEDIVKNKIRHILKKDTEKEYARKCDISIVSKTEANEFLEKYHIQGSDKSSLKLGLYDKNKILVSIMTFSKKRVITGGVKNSNEYELVRFASSKSVIGGFSKLIKYAKKKYFKNNEIFTYADLRWSNEDNNVYLKNGFKLLHISKPNYFYTDGHKRIHRYSFRKNVLKKKFPDLYDDSLTEKQIMNKTKYFTIHDCGNAVFKYN